MIDWDKIVRDQGFTTEDQMWQTLIVSLRNNEAIAKHLGVSRGVCQRRRAQLGLNKPAKRTKNYRQAEKKNILKKLPEDVWNMPLEDIVSYILDTFDVKVSAGYVSKYRKQYRS